MDLKECRGCKSTELVTFADLGLSPISNDFLDSKADSSKLFPLVLLVCKSCAFLQLSEVHEREIHFNRIYPYFSRNSKTWVQHCALNTKELIERFELNQNDLIIEVASNDGTYIENFLNLGFNVLGIEPSANVAEASIKREIPTRIDFFSHEMAVNLKDEGYRPKVILGNNVLAHVPDIVDFLSGISHLLSSESIAVIEFPHATQMIRNNQFDTIYHEHYSYLNLSALLPIFNQVGLEVFDVQEHDLHGGSLRIFLQPLSGIRKIRTSVEKILVFEKQWNPLLDDVKNGFQRRQMEVVRTLREKLIFYKREGLRVVAFGAAAKGTTLLNVAGIDANLIEFVIDSSVAKQGKWVPGTGIEIRSPEVLKENSADVILILAWNFAREIIKQIQSELPVPKVYLIPIPMVLEILQN
jgi:hypothetical protein